MVIIIFNNLHIKRIISIALAVLCCITPVFAHAESINVDFEDKVFKFDIASKLDEQWIASPGDAISYNYKVNNISDCSVEVQLIGINNIGDSGLYPALLASVNGGNSCNLYDVESSSVILKPKDSFVFNLELCFPENAGNSFQNKDLKAEVLFKVITDGSNSSVGIEKGDNSVVVTGDSSNLEMYLVMAVISLTAMVVLSNGCFKNGREKE